MNESKQCCTCTEDLGHFTQKFSAKLLSSRTLQLGVSHGTAEHVKKHVRHRFWVPTYKQCLSASSESKATDNGYK